MQYTRWRGLAASLLVAALIWPQAGHAGTPADPTDLVHVTLVTDQAAVEPGQKLAVGVHQDIAPGWHTYWLNPGDAGLATSVSWSLPPGSSAGPIRWPVPQRFAQDGVVNLGYAHAVTLPVDLKVPTHARVGTTFTAQAKVSWLACHDACVPQSAVLTLHLPIEDRARKVATSVLPATDEPQPPMPAPWRMTVSDGGDHIDVHLPAQALDASVKEVWFFPEQSGVIDLSAPPRQARAGDQFILSLKKGEAALELSQPLAGVLVFSRETPAGLTRTGYHVRAVQAGAGPAPVEAAPPLPSGDLDTASALVLAFLGGLVLNLMPCVFPVLSIKALSLMQQSAASPRHARRHGWAYTAGVLSSFAAIGVVLAALKASGAQVGWGFQFHSTAFVVFTAYLVLAIGLNLSGVFTIGSSLSGLGSAWADREGYAGSFATGVLATTVATPCTAPFMGGAIGYAITQPLTVLLSVLLSLGAGLAFPYLLISHWPRLQRWLPRPGAWMDLLKQALAFPMYATAAWLVWVASHQSGSDALAIALGGMVLIGLAAWIYDRSRPAGVWHQRGGSVLASLTVLGTLLVSFLMLQEPASAKGQGVNAATDARPATDVAWQAYSPDLLQTLRQKGEPVFLDLTADWCLTCLVNEHTALNRADVDAAFQAAGVHRLKGDWTRQDPAISAILSRFGRSGVPLYVFYPAGVHSAPAVLPQILTPGVVLSAIKQGHVNAQREDTTWPHPERS